MVCTCIYIHAITAGHLVISGGGLALFHCLLGEAGDCGNEVADELISSDVTEPQHYGSPCVHCI